MCVGADETVAEKARVFVRGDAARRRGQRRKGFVVVVHEELDFRVHDERGGDEGARQAVEGEVPKPVRMAQRGFREAREDRALVVRGEGVRGEDDGFERGDFVAAVRGGALLRGRDSGFQVEDLRAEKCRIARSAQEGLQPDRAEVVDARGDARPGFVVALPLRFRRPETPEDAVAMQRYDDAQTGQGIVVSVFLGGRWFFSRR
nr:hypothetical protein CFP56_58766 [Quercus suber]